MKDGREMLAKLAAGTVSFSGSSRAGLPEYSGVELAGVLAGLSEHARNLALYRYCGDGSVRPVIFYFALLRVVDLAVAGKWKLPDADVVDGRKVPAEILRKMTAAALFELLEIPDCVECGGAGAKFVPVYQDEAVGLVRRRVQVGTERVVCRSCRGLGHDRPARSTLADALGRSRQQYYEVWHPRYELIVDDLSKWISDLESDLSNTLRKQMRGS